MFRKRSPYRYETFDIFASKVWRSFGGLSEWSRAEADDSVAGAGRFALGFLRQNKRARRRFPRAVSEGEHGSYAEWLRTKGTHRLGLSPAALRHIQMAFQQAAQQRVREIFLHSPDLQRRFPRALLPVGQKKFVQWLINRGAAKYDFNAEDILWFLHETAESVPEMLLQTWLIAPAWQEQFPLAEREGRQDFVRWARRDLAGSPGSSRLKALPTILEQFAESAVAPSSSRETKGVNLLSHFCYPSGLQRAGWLVDEALRSAGYEIARRDVPTFRRYDTESRTPFLGLERFPTTIINVSPQPYFRDAFVRSGLFPRSDVRRVAYWLWELEDVPVSWLELAPMIDEIWTPTEFVADAFRRRFPNPVRVVPLPVHWGEIEKMDRAGFGIAPDDYVFTFIFDMCSEIARKNPFAVIRAFQQAFPEPRKVRLLIKVSRGFYNPADLAALQDTCSAEGIIFVDRVLSYPQTLGLLQMCDCFVSLHRAEGFGLCLAEAMSLGKPTIATNYSGNLAFMNAQNSLLVAYRLREIIEDNAVYPQGFHWAEPSVDHAATQMHWCYENRDAAAEIGLRGQQTVRLDFSVETAGRAFARQLERLNASGAPSNSFPRGVAG